MKQISIIGSIQSNREDMLDVLELAHKGKVKPVLEIYELREINRVMARLEEGKVRYRAVMML